MTGFKGSIYKLLNNNKVKHLIHYPEHFYKLMTHYLLDNRIENIWEGLSLSQ